MTKSPDAFRTIREVSEEVEVPQHVLRFWETKFTQVRPLKRGGGRRYYRPEDVELLRRIRGLLYQDGYTIRGVQKLLRETGGKIPTRQPPVAPVMRETVQAPALKEALAPTRPGGQLSGETRARMESLLTELETLRDMLHGRVRG